MTCKIDETTGTCALDCWRPGPDCPYLAMVKKSDPEEEGE